MGDVLMLLMLFASILCLILLSSSRLLFLYKFHFILFFLCVCSFDSCIWRVMSSLVERTLSLSLSLCVRSMAFPLAKIIFPSCIEMKRRRRARERERERKGGDGLNRALALELAHASESKNFSHRTNNNTSTKINMNKHSEQITVIQKKTETLMLRLLICFFCYLKIHLLYSFLVFFEDYEN